MSRLERWFLRRLCWKLVKQGHNHKRNIIDFYCTMRLAMVAEFTEDNVSTLDNFAHECLWRANKLAYEIAREAHNDAA